MKGTVRRCDANHCSAQIDASKGMCPRHWAMLPADVQRRIYAAARRYKTSAQRLSSVEFLEAWADAVEFIARAEERLERNTFRNLANMVKGRQLLSGKGVAS